MTDRKPPTTDDDYLGDGVYIGRVAYAKTNDFILWTERWTELGVSTHWIALESDMVDRLLNYQKRINRSL